MNIQVNCELGLYEYLDDPYFEKEGIKNDLDIYDTDLMRIINYKYRSIVYRYELKYPETEKKLLNRTKKVLQYLKGLKNSNILVVSHLSTINAIIKNIYPSHDIDTSFKMGELIQIKFT